MRYIRIHEYKPDYGDTVVIQKKIVFPFTIDSQNVMVVGMITSWIHGGESHFSIYSPEDDRYYSLDTIQYPEYFAIIE